ncbi:hypothetical protein GGQ85_003561 [Nitrobacter vulgaris]|jgi:hypothetical protein|uniref:hypothetical protein n=1 Tax=Nitrobacter vulgaris TaxID=29421 RepID=UPI00285A0CF8|nr:hypothetical protein [Nitrobacter vulgaris]MDR6305836.1 hypothetical protein [Nitrobacter vulgaris]
MDEQTLDPTKALADIQALTRVALESADPAVMRRDLEMILMITEEALQPPDPPPERGLLLGRSSPWQKCLDTTASGHDPPAWHSTHQAHLLQYI